MADSDNFVHRALMGGTVSALGAGVVLLAAIITGQLLVVLFMHLFGGAQVNDVLSFMVLLAVSFVFGLMSGVGLILFAVELWFLVKLLHDEIAAIDYFFLVAACQVGLYIGATVVSSTFHETWYIGPLSLLTLGLLWWGSKLLRRRAEAADIARMKEEGEEFRAQMRERHRGLSRRRY